MRRGAGSRCKACLHPQGVVWVTPAGDASAPAAGGGMHFRVAAFPASCSPQLAKVQHLKATGRRPPRPATPAPVRADRGFQLLPPSTLHPVLHVRLFALLEEKEEPDPKEGISKVGGRGACRPTTEATSPDTIHSVGWDHHGGQGSKLGEDTERPAERAGTGCRGQGRRPLRVAGREPSGRPVALSLLGRAAGLARPGQPCPANEGNWEP